jgi:RimJ/RimL family protein N-acetyltransferase
MPYLGRCDFHALRGWRWPPSTSRRSAPGRDPLIDWDRRELRPDYPLRTERLVLRPFIDDDLDDLFEIYSRADVTRYLYWGPRSRTETVADLERRLVQSALVNEGQLLSLAIVRSESDRVVGEVTLKWLSRAHRQGEVGFSLHPDCYGCGFATEAATALMTLGFSALGLHRIMARCDVRNHASVRVCERLGMLGEAHFIDNEMIKGEWCEEVVYAIREDEWRAHMGTTRLIR